ncbi:uncharacterized protein LOC126758750 [Bactrocera neohumeralis]|uniref:uncharacterized protein LOC126758750 n=1 Tax=Bactrocera neohumeralis TaxID=98809 RepID=UPI002165E0D8|nr:uncharacterized protein LOC126758750 [Bactrocera neohumeralis]
MKAKSLCLSVFIVAFLLASEKPRVNGIFLPSELLGFAAKELNSLITDVSTGVSAILLPERSTMRPIPRGSRGSQTYVDTKNLQVPDTSDENKETASSTQNNESENKSNSQKTDVTDEEKETNNSAEKNGSGSKEGEVSVETANTQKSDNTHEAEKSSENQESIGKILDLDNFLKSLVKYFNECKLKQSKGKHESYSNVVCQW